MQSEAGEFSLSGSRETASVQVIEEAVFEGPPGSGGAVFRFRGADAPGVGSAHFYRLSEPGACSSYT